MFSKLNEESKTSNNMIDIHIINNKGFIWNADDWYILRTTHRMLGSLIGTLPSTPRQEDQNGLPCLLLIEEVRLLVENCICRTVKYPSFTSLHVKETTKINPSDTLPNIIIHLDEICSNIIEVPLPEFINDLERIRYKVFKDLWSKGFYLTCGMKFGGDPLAYHAKYIVNCRDLDKQIMVSRSRVSSITNKRMVLAKDDGNSIKYLIYHLDDKSQNNNKINYTF
ncbi:tRNA-splicing endonuclease subunit Sen34 isoform X2 [Rhopalosiphum maidis]|uniref:tRNA-splicing endonuclease subunit Sen34 isoform X2 n=1 Tax=Rhopalosiphum maidis TaxID=43146 RepID=UPI000EFE18B7|nr:tRNA-splicing endonuclease subunit Sen34 isoform X2 [Rhopalosiphum maidis]